MKLSLDCIDYYNSQLEDLPTMDVLIWAIDIFGSEITLASSLGPQSIILTDMLCQIQPEPDIFFIDTGRLPPETYSLLNRCMDYFGIHYRIFAPEQKYLEKFLRKIGPNGIFKSIENRKNCCEIRKVRSLKRALNKYSAWISGIRRSQNSQRSNAKILEWDNRFGVFKINPMVNWTEEEVWDYISDNALPYNKLHDKGYKSIGCAPCSRAVEDGEDPRSGRWWWEENTSKECGLNVLNDHDHNSIRKVKLEVPNIFANL